MKGSVEGRKESTLIIYLTHVSDRRDFERGKDQNRERKQQSSLHFLGFSSFHLEIRRRRRGGDSLRGDSGRAIKDRTEPIGDEIIVDSKEEVMGLLEFVDILCANILQICPHRLGCLRKIIMGNLREEKMVHHMAIGDVVAERVDQGTIFTIYSFKGSIGKLPGGIIMN